MTIDERCPRCGCKLVADQIEDVGGDSRWVVWCALDACWMDRLSIDGMGPTIEAAVADMMEMHEMTKGEG